jgi:hypothetical protein
MRRICLAWLVCAPGLLPTCGHAADVNASAPLERSVTIYRARQTATDSRRSPESLDLNNLRGFALVSETRTVNLPAGESTVRFEGVADGIEPETALISGLPAGIVEKNQDARVLSPAQLIAAALGQDIVLVRTHPKSGQATRIPGVLRSDANGGVVFQSAEGIEALRCSGLPETFRFEARTDLGASPTLSVLVRNPKATSATLTLSYLSRGFDWTATYVAELAADSRTMDLGAWVTLANNNAVSFPTAHAQVVAGQLNREREPIHPAPSEPGVILARCWPLGTTTSDLSSYRGAPGQLAAPAPLPQAAAGTELMEMVVTAKSARSRAALVEEEQLADLKLYRVPEPTSIQSRQMKQVRLLDRSDVPVEIYYAADLIADIDAAFFAARKKLRTRNDAQHHLGLPLPSGQIDTYASSHGASLLIGESAVRDTALDEEVEVELGDSSEIQVKATTEKTSLASSLFGNPPAELQGVRRFESASVDQVHDIQIVNSRDAEIAFELKIQLRVGAQLIAADPVPVSTAGRPLFRVSIPAGGSTTIRYQTEHTEVHADR